MMLWLSDCIFFVSLICFLNCFILSLMGVTTITMDSLKLGMDHILDQSEESLGFQTPYVMGLGLNARVMLCHLTFESCV